MLPADFAKLGEGVAALDSAGVDRIQWDIMDGQFVPNITVGPDTIAACRSYTDLPFEAHLMIYRPETLAKEFVAAGCSRLIVHAEACVHLHRALGAIGDLGATAGVALSPATPVSAVEHVLDLVDLVLVMTVNPGFGGQQYIATMEPKIRQMEALLDARGLRDSVDIEIDGGVSAKTISGAAAAGANVFVVGSALFKHPSGLGAATTELRELAEAARH